MNTQTKAARLQELETAGLVASDSFHSFPSLVADTPVNQATRQQQQQQQQQNELTEGEESVPATRYAQVGRKRNETTLNTSLNTTFSSLLLTHCPSSLPTIGLFLTVNFAPHLTIVVMMTLVRFFVLVRFTAAPGLPTAGKRFTALATTARTDY